MKKFLATLTFFLLLLCKAEHCLSNSISITEGTNFAVAVSPDGKTLAIDLQGAIRVLPVEGGHARDLTGWLDDARLPQWSPDGKRIAYQSYRDGNWHIWLISAAGGEPQQITFGSTDDREPAWDPGGESLVFASDRSGNFDIWRVGLESGALDQLTSAQEEEYSPAVNAQGSLAYVFQQAGWGGKSLIRVQSDDETLNVHESNAKLEGLSWLSGGKTIGFFAYDDRWTASVTALRSIDLSGGEVRSISVAEEDVFPKRSSWTVVGSIGEALGGRIFYTADGRIKWQSENALEKGEVAFEVSLRIDKKPYQRKSYNFFDFSKKQVKGIFNPSISPDGQTVAFTALGDVWLRSSDGSLVALTNDHYLDIDPSFSRDGSKIVYASDRSGHMNIWQRDLKSGQDQQLTMTEDSQSMPVLSPDGSHLVYMRSKRKNLADTNDVEMLDLKSGERSVLLAGSFAPGRVSFSPDGKTVAMAVVQPGSTRFREGLNLIRIIDLETGQARIHQPLPAVSLDQRAYNGPVWSPDGGYLAYSQDGSLWLLGINESGDATSEPRRLNDELSSHLSWAGDSRSLVYMATDRLMRLDIESGDAVELPVNLNWSQDVPEGKLLIRAGRLFDGEQDNYLENVDVLIEGNRIVDVVPSGQHNFQGRLIDASAKVVIPGLIDSHAHHSAVTGERLGRNWLAYGVTSVRSPGSMVYEALERKESWAAGKRFGPRLFYTGGLLDGSRVYYPMSSAISSPSMIEKEMERAAKLDYDLIKTYVRMSNDMQQQIVELAHAQGLPVATHELYPAAAYGVDSKEHLKGTARDGFGSALTLRNRSYGDVISILAETGMTETPTLALLGGFALVVREHPELLQTPVYEVFYTEEERRDLLDNFLQSYFANKSSEFLANVMSKVRADLRRKVDRGVRVIAGTDSPFIPYGLGLHVEISLYAGNDGLTPFEALMTATGWAADALNAGNQIGRIKPGMTADLLIIDGDPLRQVSDTLKIDTVISNGRALTPSELAVR